MNSGEDSFFKFVVASSDASEVFNFIEEALYAVPLFVDVFVVEDRRFPHRAWGYDWLDTIYSQSISDGIAVIALIKGCLFTDLILW